MFSISKSDNIIHNNASRFLRFKLLWNATINVVPLRANLCDTINTNVKKLIKCEYSGLLHTKKNAIPQNSHKKLNRISQNIHLFWSYRRAMAYHVPGGHSDTHRHSCIACLSVIPTLSHCCYKSGDHYPLFADANDGCCVNDTNQIRMMRT